MAVLNANRKSESIQCGAVGEADSTLAIEDLTFDYKPEFSSWVALRIFPACHTNPVFVEVDGKPIRASKKSAQWCVDAVETCWKATGVAAARIFNW